MAKEMLEKISADERLREKYYAREKVRRDTISRLKYAERKGMEKGIEKGIEEGMEKGIEEGMERGIEEGMERGIEEGMERGIEKGVKKGIEENKEKTAIKAIEIGLSIDKIIKLTGLTKEEIEKLKKEFDN